LGARHTSSFKGKSSEDVSVTVLGAQSRSIGAIVIAMIEASLETLLMATASSTPLLHPYGYGA